MSGQKDSENPNKENLQHLANLIEQMGQQNTANIGNDACSSDDDEQRQINRRPHVNASHNEQTPFTKFCNQKLHNLNNSSQQNQQSTGLSQSNSRNDPLSNANSNNNLLNNSQNTLMTQFAITRSNHHPDSAMPLLQFSSPPQNNERRVTTASLQKTEGFFPNVVVKLDFGDVTEVATENTNSAGQVIKVGQEEEKEKDEADQYQLPTFGGKTSNSIIKSSNGNKLVKKEAQNSNNQNVQLQVFYDEHKNKYQDNDDVSYLLRGVNNDLTLEDEIKAYQKQFMDPTPVHEQLEAQLKKEQQQSNNQDGDSDCDEPAETDISKIIMNFKGRGNNNSNNNSNTINNRSIQQNSQQNQNQVANNSISYKTQTQNQKGEPRSINQHQIKHNQQSQSAEVNMQIINNKAKKYQNQNQVQEIANNNRQLNNEEPDEEQDDNYQNVIHLPKSHNKSEFHSINANNNSNMQSQNQNNYSDQHSINYNKTSLQKKEIQTNISPFNNNNDNNNINTQQMVSQKKIHHTNNKHNNTKSSKKSGIKTKQQKLTEMAEQLNQKALDQKRLEMIDYSKFKKKYICNCKKSKCLKLYCDCFAVAEFCGPECNCQGCFNSDQHQPERIQAMISLMDRNPIAFEPKVNEQQPDNLDKNEEIQEENFSQKALANYQKQHFSNSHQKQLHQMANQQNHSYTSLNISISPNVSSQKQQGENQQQLQQQQQEIAVVDHQSALQQQMAFLEKEKHHTRGCNCKNSKCLKKYCECRQGGVFCSPLCKCEDCQNQSSQNNNNIDNVQSSNQNSNHAIMNNNNNSNHNISQLQSTQPFHHPIYALASNNSNLQDSMFPQQISSYRQQQLQQYSNSINNIQEGEEINNQNLNYHHNQAYSKHM